MAFTGLYGDLPSAKDQKAADDAAAAKKEGWAGSGLFAPSNLAAKRQSKHNRGTVHCGCAAMAVGHARVGRCGPATLWCGYRHCRLPPGTAAEGLQVVQQNMCVPT